MVLAIIAIVVGLAAPAISNAMLQRRANEAALDLVRIVREARSEAAAYGRAHLLRFTASTPGRIDLYRGENDSCNGNDWPTLTAGGCSGGNLSCIDALVLSDKHYSPLPSQVRLALANQQITDVCYEPTGVMWWRPSSAVPFSDLNNNALAGGVLFTLTPYMSGTQKGVTRRVVLPLGGDARIVR